MSLAVRRAALRDLVEHAHLAERIVAVEIGFAQHADLPRVEAVEAAHCGDAVPEAIFMASFGQLVDKVKYLSELSPLPAKAGTEANDSLIRTDARLA